MQRIGRDYISSLKAPLNDETIRSVAQFTTSRRDGGVALVRENADAFKKVLGKRQYVVNLMNLIYNGEMKAMIDGNASPDWSAIEAITNIWTGRRRDIFKVRAVYFINAQHWASYGPVAKLYVEKYGVHIQENEKKMFQQAIDEHSR